MTQTTHSTYLSANACKLFVNQVRASIRLLLAAMLLCSLQVNAEEDEETDAPADVGSSYVKIEPPFVTNYGNTNRLRYVKADVSLKVANGGGTEQTSHHMPAIKDIILGLLSQQSDQELNTIEGKEALRALCQTKIAEFLEEEDSENYVQEVLFTSFVAHTL